MLRIGVLGLSANAYGGDSYFQAFLPALGRYAQDVECVVVVRDNRYRSLCEPYRNIKLCTLKIPGINSGPMRILFEQIILPRKLSALGLDLIYTATNLAILRAEVPCVISIRNMEPLAPARYGTPVLLKIRQRLLRRLTECSVRRASRVIAVSEFVRRTLVLAGVPSEKIGVVYHGIDDLPSGEERFEDRNPGDMYVAAAAKFIRYANLETLFRGFAKMRKLGYGGELRFAGGSYDKEYEREIKNLIRDLGVERHVRFLGYLPRHKVQELISGADVFLFPSTLEACPFTLLEAMRRGAPIVTTSAMPMPEFCQDAAVYVEPKDSDAFGLEAHRLAVDKQLRQSYRLRALRRAESFRWEDSVRRLVSLWEKAACTS